MSHPIPVDAIVADIGGTNARFAWRHDDAPGVLCDPLTFPCADFENLPDAVEAYCARTGLHSERLSVAVACPAEGESIRLTNNHWAFERHAVMARLSLREMRVINDFTAQALAVPLLGPAQRRVLHDVPAQAWAPVLVIGPGTGLGVGALVPGREGWVPVVTEGGHVTANAVEPEDRRVIEWLQSRYAHVSAERLVSGPGLENVYRARCTLDGVEPLLESAADIAAAGLERSDPQAREALDCFARVFGVVAGDAAVTLGARGGIVIAGGMVPRMLDDFAAGPFLGALQCKGRFSEYLKAVPVSVVLAGDAGLMGASAALDNEHLLAAGYAHRLPA